MMTETMADEAAAEAWQQMPQRRRRRGTPRREAVRQQVSAPLEPVDLFAMIEACERRLRASSWWHRAMEALKARRPSASLVVCYGLGSIFESRSSRLQLAFALTLRSELGAKLAVFDPILSTNEGAFLADRLQCQEAPALQDLRDLDDLVVYMPHCPHSLYCSLVATTAKKDRGIESLVLLGNSFRAYAARTLDRDLDPHLKAALDTLLEVDLDPGPHDADLERAFNDTALMHWQQPISFKNDTPPRIVEKAIKENAPDEEERRLVVGHDDDAGSSSSS